MTNPPITNAGSTGANLRGAVDLSSLLRPKTAVSGASLGEPGGAGGASGASGASGVSGTNAAAASGAVVRDASDATFTEVLDLSATVPVLVEFYGQGIQPALGPVVEQYSGRVALVTVDTTTNPQLVQAFQVQQVPTVAAVVGGRPVQLFVGSVPEQELREVIDQVLQLAAQNGVNGSLPATTPGGSNTQEAAAGTEAGAEVEPPLPPHHEEAFDAIAAGDFALAIKEYETAIAQNPRDQLAVAGLAQVSLLARLATLSESSVRAAAKAQPDDVPSALNAADLDISGGHLDDAFGRLLDLFASLDAPNKDLVRTRILDYFEIIGADDPGVIAARRRLTGLLY
ncbi:MAG: tetratricopeptide repeat protein [Salinibacterium sp.]|nr:tetratricopeptide repeat protein [Salinibacterium sp.]